MKSDLFISIWNNNHFNFLILGVEAKNQIWLIIKYEPDMQHLHAIADEPKTPAYILKQLKNRKLLTHFKTKAESTIPVKDWHLIDA